MGESGIIGDEGGGSSEVDVLVIGKEGLRVFV